MKDKMELNSTPYNEQNVPTTHPNYYTLSNIECTEYINQLIRTYGHPPKNSSFLISPYEESNSLYFTVEYDYDDENPTHTTYRDSLLSGLPNWDFQALQELQYKYFNTL